MHRSVRNIVFSCIAVAILASVFAYQLFCALAPGIEADEYLELSGAETATLDDLMGRSILRGKAQAFAEQLISDRAPFHDELVLLNSAQQRTLIASAASVFGYRYYPSYFNSEYVVAADEGGLYPFVELAPAKTSALDKFNATLNDIARQHADTRIAVCIVAEPQQNEANPVQDLQSQQSRMSNDWIVQHCIEPLDDGINAMIDVPATSEEFVNGWYKTDHHWTLERALVAYNMIAKSLDLREVKWDGGFEAIPSWRGSQARKGRDFDYNDVLMDMDGLPKLKFYRFKNAKDAEYKKLDFGLRERIMEDESAASELNLLDAYTSYYGLGNCIIENEEADNDKTCLVVGDSYTRCLIRYIASNYRHTVYVCPANHKVNASFRSIVDTWEPNDIIVQWQCLKAFQIKRNSPEFLS